MVAMSLRKIMQITLPCMGNGEYDTRHPKSSESRPMHVRHITVILPSPRAATKAMPSPAGIGDDSCSTAKKVEWRVHVLLSLV